MLDKLFANAAVAAITEALSSRGAPGSLAVVGNAKLATALAAARKGTDVLPIGLSARAAKKLTNALADLSSVEDRSLAAVIGADIAVDEGWERKLRDWTRVVADGGTLVFVDRPSLRLRSAARPGRAGAFSRGHAAEASRRALCAGLTEIQQRHVGRTIVTSGLVTHL